MVTADEPVTEWRRFGLAQHGRVTIVGFRDTAIPIELDHIFVPLQVHADPGRRGDGPDAHPGGDKEALGHGGTEVSLDEALARASHGRTCLALIGTAARHAACAVPAGATPSPAAHGSLRPRAHWTVTTLSLGGRPVSWNVPNRARPIVMDSSRRAVLGVTAGDGQIATRSMPSSG